MHLWQATPCLMFHTYAGADWFQLRRTENGAPDCSLRHHNSNKGSNIGKIRDELQIPAPSPMIVVENGTPGEQTGSKLGIMEVTQRVATEVRYLPAANHQKLNHQKQE